MNPDVIENEMDYSARLFWNGGLELNTNADPASLPGLCPGGGSVVYGSRVRDATPGTLAVNRAGGLVIRKRLGAEDQHRLLAGIAVIRKIFRVAGARDVIVSPVGLGFHLRLLGASARMPAALAAPPRLIELDLNGLIMDLYYSNKTGPACAGPRPLDVRGFDLTPIKEDRPA